MIIKLYKKHLAISLCLCVIFCTSVAAKQSTDKICYKLPIIMYHHISKSKGALGSYVISPETFENDIKYLSENGYKSVTAKQLIEFTNKGTPLFDKSVMITFDDGYESFYAYAFDILKKYNFTAVLSVIGSQADKYSSINDHNILYSNCSWDQLKQMQDSGIVEIGNHTYDLHTFGQRKGCKIKKGEDINEYKAMLKKDLLKNETQMKNRGIDCYVFTYPFGKTCDSAKTVIEQLGYKISLGCEEKINLLYKGNPKQLQNMKRFNRAEGKSSEQFFNRIINN